MKVSIVLVVRNREDYIKFLNDLFLEIEQRASNSIQFEYIFFMKIILLIIQKEKLKNSMKRDVDCIYVKI
jgi:hypothetical protein